MKVIEENHNDRESETAPFLSRRGSNKGDVKGRTMSISRRSSVKSAIGSDGKSKRSCLQEIMQILQSPQRLYEWIRFISKEFGWKFFFLVVIGIHISKGFVMTWVRQATKFWYRDHGGVDAPSMQVYLAVARTPWTLKGIMGLISDSTTVFGYKRNVYLFVTTSLGLIASLYLTLLPAHAVEIAMAIGAFVLINLSVSAMDLLVEARYSEQVKEKPQYGADIVTFVTAGMAMAGIVAAVTVGPVLQHFDVQWAFSVVVIANAFNMVPIVGNFMEEEPNSNSCFSFNVETIRKFKSFFYLAALMAVISIGILVLGLTLAKMVYTSMMIAYASGIIVIVGFWLLTPRRIAKIGTYFILMSMTHLGTEAACFYFFTDTPKQYPEGPHFSKMFYTTSMALVPSVFILVGAVIYNAFLRGYSWRAIFFFPAFLGFFMEMLFVTVYLRWNERIGIPDAYFVVGSEAIQDLVHALNYIPMALVVSHLCHDGLEATMFALLAGSRNMGRMIGDFGGAALLKAFSVEPRGRDNESEEFRYLWLVAVIGASVHLIPLSLIPWCVPKGCPGDRDLIDELENEVNGVDREGKSNETKADIESHEKKESSAKLHHSSRTSSNAVVDTTQGVCVG